MCFCFSKLCVAGPQGLNRMFDVILEDGAPSSARKIPVAFLTNIDVHCSDSLRANTSSPPGHALVILLPTTAIRLDITAVLLCSLHLREHAYISVI